MQYAGRGQPYCEQQVEGQRVDMEERQHAQKGLLTGFQTVAAAGVQYRLAGCRRQVAVGEDRAFGHAGRAAGVLQHRDRAVDIDSARRFQAAFVGDQVYKADARFAPGDIGGAFRAGAVRHCLASHHFLQIADHQAAQPGRLQHLVHQRKERRRVQRDDDVGLAVGNLVPHDIGGVQRRIVNDSAASLQDGEEHHDIMRRVGQVEADVNPGPHAELAQSRNGPVCKLAQFSVGELMSFKVDRHPVRPGRRSLVEQLVDRALAQLGMPV